MRAVRLRSVLCSPLWRQRQHTYLSRRTFANFRDERLSVAFTPSFPSQQESKHQHGDHEPPDERTLKLGETLRILQPRLPNLLASPLPQDILSPHISLHLFPSTHPHLPTVSGRVAYHAALWTSPITWGKIPLIGNVNLEILSERMVKSQSSRSSREKLVVRWRTMGKTKGLGTGGGYKGIGAGQSVDKITAWLGGDEKSDSREFCGLFIFEFDERGRILDHVIERADEGWNSDQWENGLGRVVGLTDWLLGRLNGGAKLPSGLALGCQQEKRLRDRR